MQRHHGSCADLRPHAPPCRRPAQGIGPVSRSQYLQMVGRAGRAGHADAGESFLIGKGWWGMLECVGKLAKPACLLMESYLHPAPSTWLLLGATPFCPATARAGAAGGQEWHQVCGLLTAPIPVLQSRVLCPEAAALFGEPLCGCSCVRQG